MRSSTRLKIPFRAQPFVHSESRTWTLHSRAHSRARKTSTRIGCQSHHHVKLGLAGKLTVQPGSRHERLIEAMGNDEVVGLYFPCLTEYSLPAALERVASLPEHLLLAGGFDTAAAFVGVPDLLLRTDGYPPLLWLTGLAGEKPGIGYHFEAYGHDLTFNRRAHLGQTAEYWWSGISVLETR